jgi:hypothetical protein
MVYFRTKNTNVRLSLKALKWTFLVYFIAISVGILRPFWYFKAIWYILWSIGTYFPSLICYILQPGVDSPLVKIRPILSPWPLTNCMYIGSLRTNFPCICYHARWQILRYVCICVEFPYALIQLRFSPPSFDTGAWNLVKCGNLQSHLNKFGLAKVWTRVSQMTQKQYIHY